MFPFLCVVESLEPMDEKRDQGACTAGREHIPHSSKIQHTCIHTTQVESCIPSHKNMRTEIFVLLHFQISQSEFFCLREGNHLGFYSFVQKMGTIVTLSKCCEKACIRFRCWNNELVKTSRAGPSAESWVLRLNLMTDSSVFHRPRRPQDFHFLLGRVTNSLRAFSTVFSSSTY